MRSAMLSKTKQTLFLSSGCLIDILQLTTNASIKNEQFGQMRILVQQFNWQGFCTNVQQIAKMLNISRQRCASWWHWQKVEGEQSTGMGSRTSNFHSGVNETNHKADKTAACRTQKMPSKLEIHFSKTSAPDGSCESRIARNVNWCAELGAPQQGVGPSKASPQKEAKHPKHDIQNRVALSVISFARTMNRSGFTTSNPGCRMSTNSSWSQSCAHTWRKLWGRWAIASNLFLSFHWTQTTQSDFWAPPWFLKKSWWHWATADWVDNLDICWFAWHSHMAHLWT